MACLTSGRTKQCASAISGGNKFLYLADLQDIDVVTIGVNGEVTGITMLAAAVFYKYEFATDTANFTEELTNENCSTLVVQQFVMNWRGRNLLTVVVEWLQFIVRILVFLGFGAMMIQKKFSFFLLLVQQVF